MFKKRASDVVQSVREKCIPERKYSIENYLNTAATVFYFFCQTFIIFCLVKPARQAEEKEEGKRMKER